MYSSILVKGFRTFSTFELSDLRRVNLLVGKNNAGKTSLLEAIEMLAMGGHPASLVRSPRRRGETEILSTSLRTQLSEINVRHLFFGHKLYEGASFSLTGRLPDKENKVVCSVVRPQIDNAEDGASIEEAVELDSAIGLLVSGPENSGTVVPVSPGGSVHNFFRRISPADRRTVFEGRVGFLGTEDVDTFSLQNIWDELVLTPEEDKVVSVMKIIEPSIERLAFAATTLEPGSTAFLKLAGEKQRLPLGSLGDGTRRLLTLAIFLTRASNGVLLVDEIDTGLHYTTLESMWRFVIETARRLDVQVFATSHSGDCVRALAWLQTDAPDLASEVSVHRIERNAENSVRYSAAEIEVAARHHVEVRG